MRKALLLVFTLLMLASFSFGIVFAAAQNEFDENPVGFKTKHVGIENK